MKNIFSKPSVSDAVQQNIWSVNSALQANSNNSFDGRLYYRLENGVPVSPLSSRVKPSSSVGSYSSTPQQLQYIDAPYAELYGMSAETAYQEALVNTAHQREVADLKAAGLNPVLGISGSGSSAFSGSLPSSSVGSGKAAAEMSFSDNLALLVGGAVGVLTRNSGLGNSASNVVKGLGKLGFLDKLGLSSSE